ncbi:MAG: glycoside hydrolase family 3 protein [Marinoscillum sp.]
MKKILIALLTINTLGLANAQTPDPVKVDSLDFMIGQMIMVGIGDFNRLDKKAPIFSAIEANQVGGVILFEKNLYSKNTEQNLREILEFAQSKASLPLFVSIDEEGGRVNRLKTRYGFPKTVTAQYLGELDNLDSTSFYAKRTAGILYQLGINMNFAPSVDVNINPDNPVIGKIGRSYSPDPYLVARHAQAVVDAHELFGVATVLKHFPGHGSSKNDSHLGLTDVSTTWRFEELLPYKALLDSGKVKAIMTAHIVNDVLDDSKVPATLSDKVISEVLRGFLDFDGVVVSDDMQMKAISAQYGLEEAIKRTILAGVDILLFANNVPDYDLVTADQLHGIIRKFVKNGDISRERVAESYKRIITLKQEMGLAAQ